MQQLLELTQPLCLHQIDAVLLGEVGDFFEVLSEAVSNRL